MPWANVWVAYLLAGQCATATMEDVKAAPGESDPSEYNEVVTTEDTKTIDALSSHIIHARARTAHTGEGINVMTQALCDKDGSLPQGLTVQNTYKELCSGSKNVTVMVRNGMAYPHSKEEDPGGESSHGHMSARTTCADWRDRGINWGPELPPKWTTKQRQETLFEELDLSGLESWPPELVDCAWSLLAEYHNIFSLEPIELDCTHSAEHVIKATDDTPFNEQFRCIPPPLLEEVHIHLWEMLDSGAICPILWVHGVMQWCWFKKKDGILHFRTEFHCLNAHMKKASYPLPRIQEVLESLEGAGHFSCLDLKSWFWQIKMDESLKQYTAFTVGNLGFFECNCMPFGLCNAPATFNQLMQNCIGGLNLIYCLIYLDSIVIFSQTVK